MKEAELGYLFTKCAIEGDDAGNIDKKLGELTVELDDNSRRVLLDETKLRMGTKKGKTEEKKEAGRKKKHKKKKAPKKVDGAPTLPPDPERWLPKWKRSKYRKQFRHYGKLRETQGDASTTTQVGACTLSLLICV